MAVLNNQMVIYMYIYIYTYIYIYIHRVWEWDNPIGIHHQLVLGTSATRMVIFHEDAWALGIEPSEPRPPRWPMVQYGPMVDVFQIRPMVDVLQKVVVFNVKLFLDLFFYSHHWPTLGLRVNLNTLGKSWGLNGINIGQLRSKDVPSGYLT